MLKNNFLPLILLLMTNFLVAQISVSGIVSFADETTDQPVPGWQVDLYLGADGHVGTAITDDSGYYEISSDATFPGQAPYYVETLDVCSDEIIRVEWEPIPGTIAYEANIVLCEGIEPPDPVDECHAFFYSEQVGHDDEGYAVAFFDISYHSGEIMSWEWNFGDGTSSSEQNPTHIYAATGDYLVSLTINGIFSNGEACMSRIEYDVVVWDEADCDCPTDEYDPVCVISPSGQVFEFSNPCYAECAGVETFVSCEPDCVCPEFYAPVCITFDNGEVLTFDNHCFAECAGYTPDQWEECEPDDCSCPDEYNPVCITSFPGGPIITFDNPCLAECAGFEPGDYQDCDSDCVCPDFYEPVCVMVDGTLLTFSNFCYAECAGYSSDQWTVCETDCDCPTDLYDPVCVATPGGLILTFDNPCLAECEGFTANTYYPCDGEGCFCPEYEDPVCVLTEQGDTLTFSNPCFAECEGFTPEQWFYCDQVTCDCPTIYDPVCVAGFAGIITFGNACLAECAGFTEDMFVDCEEDCICPDVWDPVCVLISDSTPSIEIIHFPNACYAECAGFTQADFVDCEEDCICPDVWDPVCVVDADGHTITFGNPCEAECAGYDPADFVDCDGGGCGCDQVWDPVCVAGVAGTITYPNECVALCEGFSPSDFVDCIGCECDDFYLPVCVIDPATGVFLEFTNPCYAACAGYGQDAIVPCFPTDNCWAEFDFHPVDDSELSIQFLDLSIATDIITSWFWDFGDGETSTEQNPMHTYAEGGVYDITLIVSSEGCGEFVATQHICIGNGGGVGGPDCQSFFFLEQADIDNLLSFQFIDLSLGNVNAWVWSFGDGETSTEQNPIHTYTEAGEYTVTLSIFAGDCQSTVSIPITVGEDIWYGDLSCRAWFLPISSPDNNDVFFINLSSPDAVEFTWDFGDGEISNNPLALHNYAEAGTYTVTLTIVTTEGCVNSFSATVTIGTDGDDGFGANPSFSLVTKTDEVAQLKGLQAAPNPTNGELRISWEVQQAGSYNWQVFDINGRLVTQREAKAATGVMTTIVDLSNQPSGIYLFRLQTPDGIQTLRVSKI